MQNVKELQRQPAPAGKPQPLAFYRGKLWIGCWDNHKIYGIEPKNWDVTDEVDSPGRPYGIAPHGDGLSVVVALDDDDRYLIRFNPGKGFDMSSKVACPDVTGSHLASDGKTLYLCQQGKRRILELNDRAEISREIPLSTRCAGFAFDASGVAFILTADEDFDNVEFGRMDLTHNDARVTPLAAISAEARALTFDGTSWWTSLREENEVFGFAQPSAG